MDGLDISAIEQIDQDVFNSPQSDSDGDEEMPMPDCIGIDSALQDDEMNRAQNDNQRPKTPAQRRSQAERDLEFRMLKPDSIRRQILEKSINLNSLGQQKLDKLEPKTSGATKSHVMNITEKAGMSGIDKDKINQVIHEASKGSLFYKRQAQRQAEIHKSIEKMLNRVKAATPAQVEKARLTCDRLLDDLEKQRTFNKIIVHFDLDMFFAAVEIRDNPDLKDKPVAVGGDSMVSTSNYIARRYGVRAAMPGFIAKKLCPELILIKPNGIKYRQASSEVFGILESYDPELTEMSLDEAYLDLTEYVKNTLERDSLEFQEYYDGTLPKVWWTRASSIVEEIRQAIFDKTQLTCSAGIACNTLLAKISTDINKPNGQFMVLGYPKDVSDFISKTRVEKVSGIGKVSAQFLNALEINTCGDILEKRHFLPLVFYEINVRFYLRVALGDGSASIKSDDRRKSKSVERTFTAIKDTFILLDKLDSICDELCTKYLKPYRIRGRTVTVKLKRNTFMTTTRSYSMLVPTNDKLVIYSAAKNLLLSEIANEPPEISYRLLGVKLSNLADDGVTTNQLTIDAMLKNQEMGKASTKSETTVHIVDDSSSSELEAMTSDPVLHSALPGNADDMDSDPQKSCGTNAPDTEPPTERVCVNKAAPKGISSFFKKRSAAREAAESVEGVSPDSKSEMLNVGCSNHTPVTGHSKHDSGDACQGAFPEANSSDEDFQCPYCFKAFSQFSHLEEHVEHCNMKIPIDVNRSFFSQKGRLEERSSSHSQSFFSQVQSRATRSSQATQSQRVKTSLPVKRLKTTSAPSSSSSQEKFKSTQVTQMMDKVGEAVREQGEQVQPGSRKKLSYYERFIESNSQSLRRSVEIEPLQCPYCAHGFLDFAHLESHVIMCTKKQDEHFDL